MRRLLPTTGLPGPDRVRRLERGIARAVELLIVIGGAVIVGSLIVGVFFRYVLRDSLSWTDEVAMFCFSWIVLLAAALLVRESGHVRVELIENYLPNRAAKALRRFIDLLILITGIYLVWTGWNFMLLTVGQLSPAVRYPIWARNLSLPVSGLLMVVFAASNLLRQGKAASGAGSQR
ncbi:MAG: TRAP transporter small permease [Burkholderiaceae bacterium]|nr:TRAP transporter small permease [Burkholderiaceae bacterium]